MRMNDLENHSLEILNYDTDQSDSGQRRRIRRYINLWHRRILTIPGIDQLRNVPPTSFSSVANQAMYALPPSVARVSRIYEPTTNRIRLVERSLDWYRNLPTTISGVPECWIPFGKNTTQFMVGGNVSAGGLQFGPTASALYVVSTSASDTTQKVYTECFRTGGYFQRDVTVLNGTARVQINSNSDFMQCDKSYLDMPCVGNVSVYDALVGGNELLRISPGEFQVNYITLVLWPAPSGVWTFYVDCQREIHDLSLPTDILLTPPDFDDVMLMGVRYQEYEYKKDIQAMQILQVEITRRVSDLMNWVTNTDDLILVPGQQPRGTRFSNLGSWFPSGSW